MDFNIIYAFKLARIFTSILQKAQLKYVHRLVPVSRGGTKWANCVESEVQILFVDLLLCIICVYVSNKF